MSLLTPGNRPICVCEADLSSGLQAWCCSLRKHCLALCSQASLPKRSILAACQATDLSQGCSSHGVALLSCGGLLQHIVKHLSLNDLHALYRTCTASRDACLDANPLLHARAKVSLT